MSAVEKLRERPPIDRPRLVRREHADFDELGIPYYDEELDVAAGKPHSNGDCYQLLEPDSIGNASRSVPGLVVKAQPHFAWRPGRKVTTYNGKKILNHDEALENLEMQQKRADMAEKQVAELRKKRAEYEGYEG